ncbi:hypothetical protein [Blastococcus goldschmidtiae]|uniref:hypothetical protein n=1 Tax=Blastococcus goldschmidtiae TaxID=3075546 RepID=UPI0028893F46|nr:hypothetical protein [Blastococcus sp. DSM 46792]
MADACRRFSNGGRDRRGVTVDLIGTLAVSAIASRNNKRPLLTLALTIAAAALAWMAVSAPDFIEQGLP